MALLNVRHLCINYNTPSGVVPVVKDVSFSLEKGRSIGIIGESGSGKTTLGLCIMRLLPDNAEIAAGQIMFRDQDILSLPQDRVLDLRGKKIAMIFQAAMNSLNPVQRVGHQVEEVLYTHERKMTRSQVKKRVQVLFEDVGLSPSRTYDFPHQYSGGMKQRAVIAMALACSPDIIIADEPTTALDMTVQSQILEKLKEIQKEKHISIVLISHDMSVVSEICHDIAVVSNGRIIEYGKKEDILSFPSHKVTKNFMQSCITLDSSRDSLNFFSEQKGFSRAKAQGQIQTKGGQDSPAIVELKNVCKSYGSGRFLSRAKTGRIDALKHISIQIQKGEIFGLVGASGSGKTTLGRILLKLEKPDTGRFIFNDKDAGRLKGKLLKTFRKKVQMIPQDPYQSLNPYFSVYDSIAEPLIIHQKRSRQECLQTISKLLKSLDLTPASDFIHRYPHQLSGGQRQKVAIARGMVLKPEFVVADEPTSMLDPTVSMQIFSILVYLKEKYNVTFFFITHNIAAAHMFCDRIAVIHHGEIVEMGDCRSIIQAPTASHTRALIDSQPGLLIQKGLQKPSGGN
ncbi:MAG: ABC transporter ATP-binding protein [Thermodesulfobacteriota bacterium]|nr:ABC transporter ATP-binding protein [Thermodesulfobacteriota bacterium]